jgi:hypothetical protein
MTAALPIVQLIAYVTLTLASIIVGVVSALFAYRNNFGWKPLALVVGHSLEGMGGSTIWDAPLKFEIWNRRKYPIVVRSIVVEFSNLPLRPETFHTSPTDAWFRQGKSFHSRGTTTLSPSTQREFTVVAPIAEGTTLDDVAALARIKIYYFDPLYNKSRPLQITHPIAYK